MGNGVGVEGCSSVVVVVFLSSRVEAERRGARPWRATWCGCDASSRVATARGRRPSSRKPPASNISITVWSSTIYKRVLFSFKIKPVAFPDLTEAPK